MEIPVPIAAAGLHASHTNVRPLTKIWVVLMVLTLFWDFSGFDMAVMLHIGTPEGFPLRDNWWLSHVFHDRLRLLSQLAFAAMLVWAAWPMRSGGLPRRERWLLVGLVVASLLAVNLIKLNSRTSCPWDLHPFGGEARYVSHWLFGVGDGGGGRCFPGGHVSSAFAFFALCLPWLCAPEGTQRNTAIGWRWLALVMGVGLIAGVTQTLRGAHHPSHSFWTLLICSGISLIGWTWGQRFLRSGAQKSQAAGLAGSL